RRRIVTFMRRAKDGSHVESDSVTVRRARTVTVSADRPVPVFADGDYLGEMPLTVTLRRAALSLVMPG
ncbi:hypothetical protein, partial [Jatrophihabitans sp.]|uniref:hypothetical protein n=1 Tax=Jatrophihabitans sp. TaxID=1932789 RepID=UPI0030C6C021|nr:Transcription regulator [Jatrophihabitans sp.]